jgi:hypothetical protein
LSRELRIDAKTVAEGQANPSLVSMNRSQKAEAPHQQ